MRRTIVALSMLAVFMFASAPFAGAEWQENLVTNNTLEEIYVIKSTWRAADDNKGIPAGFWTRGSYRIPPGMSRIFHSWDTNSIYFRISNAAGAIKANSGTTAFAFWAHPKRSFRVVSQTLDASVTTDQLLYSDRSPGQLAQLEGFVGYTGGSAVVVTPGWVLLDGQPTAPPNDELGDDGGSPGGDVAPPAWVENVVRNDREEEIYVVFATWKVENPRKGWPEGFRTRGSYRISPGKGRVFHSWADNESFFHISNADGALKPESSSGTFEFWVHPKRKFRIVSGQLENGVTQEELLYSDRAKEELEHSDGFMVYETGSGGAEVVVTSDWVPVSTAPPLPPPPPPAVPVSMALIPAGTFQMGSSSGDTDERPVHTVSVDAFHMDTREVTNAEYAAFLNAKGKHADAGHTWLSLGSSDVHIELIAGAYRVKSGYANHPVVRVSWYGAMAYAAWVGKRLPTEAEWEYAARGGLAGKLYPWGDTVDSSRANYGGNVGRTTAGGAYAANGYGLYDMAGNVWEWCLDAYDMEFYAGSATQNPLSGASSIESLVAGYVSVDSYRVLRGGSYIYSAQVVRVSNRDLTLPMSTGGDLGFRCVKSVQAVSVAPTPVLADRSGDTDDNDRSHPSFKGYVYTPAPYRDMGSPVAGVTVTIISGGRSGESTTTDKTGMYTFPNVEGNSLQLRVEKEGYEPKEVTVYRSGPTRLANGGVPNFGVPRGYPTHTMQRTPGVILIGFKWLEDARKVLARTEVVYDLLLVKDPEFSKPSGWTGYYSGGVVAVPDVSRKDGFFLWTLVHEIAHANQHGLVGLDGRDNSAGIGSVSIEKYERTPQGREFVQAWKTDLREFGKTALDARSYYAKSSKENAAEIFAYWWSLGTWWEGGGRRYGDLQAGAPNRMKWARKWFPRPDAPEPPVKPNISIEHVDPVPSTTL